MVKALLLLTLTILLYRNSDGQERNTQNVILITLDGFRWQELFQGADSTLIFNKETVIDKNVVDSFWAGSGELRREKLLPFIWSEFATGGQLLGNRHYNNNVDCANPHWFSYPGYNEMLTGFIDRQIRSNDKIENPNMTVLEFISKQSGFENKVAAFGTWGVFPYILRENISGIHVNAGNEMAEGEISEREELLNEMAALLPNPVTERFDLLTYHYAVEYMKRVHPRVVYMAFDETDSYAHAGKYDEYLKAANRADAMIKNLWAFINSDAFYRDHTSIIITTDHGRGRGEKIKKTSWKSHGRLAFGSGQVWIGMLGPDTPALGELKTAGDHTLSQIAMTLATILHVDYTNRTEVSDAIKTAVSPETGSFYSEVTQKED